MTQRLNDPMTQRPDDPMTQRPNDSITRSRLSIIANVIWRRQPKLSALGIVLAVVASSHTLAAHDLERTAVTLTFARDGSFVLDVANDPNWLLLRLESFVENAPSSPAPQPSVMPAPVVTSAERDARLRSLGSVFIDRIVLFVDGKEVRPSSVEYVPPVPQLSSDSLAPQ